MLLSAKCAFSFTSLAIVIVISSVLVISSANAYSSSSCLLDYSSCSCIIAFCAHQLFLQDELDDVDLEHGGEDDEGEEGEGSDDLDAPSEAEEVKEEPNKWSFGVDEMYQVSIYKVDINRISVGYQLDIS